MHIQTPCSKTHKILKLNDLIQLNQSTFIQQYKNGKLPSSFTNFFQNIPFEEQKSRDDDYNLKKQTNIALLHFPSCRIARGWNQNNLLLKSEADLTAFKEDTIQKKLQSPPQIPPVDIVLVFSPALPSLKWLQLTCGWGESGVAWRESPVRLGPLPQKIT